MQKGTIIETVLTKALISAGRLSQNLVTASSILSFVALVTKYLSNSLINNLQISHSSGFASNTKIEIKQKLIQLLYSLNTLYSDEKFNTCIFKIVFLKNKYFVLVIQTKYSTPKNQTNKNQRHWLLNKNKSKHALDLNTIL